MWLFIIHPDGDFSWMTYKLSSVPEGLRSKVSVHKELCTFYVSKNGFSFRGDISDGQVLGPRDSGGEGFHTM
jgi:hypothetical protein